jgi:hypothetical protein
MGCKEHQSHSHKHGEDCGHTAIRHEGHTDYLHDGHLHSLHGDHYDEHKLSVGGANPTECTHSSCAGDHQSHGDEIVPHGDHSDFIHGGLLHHRHGDHCDEHGRINA